MINWIVRFWEKVDKVSNPPCWVWTGNTNRNGYGRACSDHAGKPHKETGNTLAHRISWILINGPIPDGLSLLHTCDNPPCVNPEHLFLGTNVDNMEDCRLKGRTAKGEDKHESTLGTQDIREIRMLWVNGVKQTDLAHMFQIRKQVVNDILRYKTWKHI